VSQDKESLRDEGKRRGEGQYEGNRSPPPINRLMSNQSASSSHLGNQLLLPLPPIFIAEHGAM